MGKHPQSITEKANHIFIKMNPARVGKINQVIITEWVLKVMVQAHCKSQHSE